MHIRKNILFWSSAFCAGIINGLLGAGGGMLIVPSLISSGFSRKKAHANSVCIIFCICLVSTFVYLRSGSVSIADSFPYLIWGILGSFIGSILLQKINQNVLRKLFGCFSIWAAYRLLTK